MRLLLVISLFSTLSFGQDLKSLFQKSNKMIQEDWARFELSVEYKLDHKTMLMELSQTDGLEKMEFDSLLHTNEISKIIEKLFETPYVVPHFCHNFYEFDYDSTWQLNPAEQMFVCKDLVKKLLLPLYTDEFVIRFYSLRGANKMGNYYKVKVMAEDIKKERSVVINFDVVID